MLLRFLRYTSVFLLIILVVFVVTLLTLDFGRFKGHVEEYVSNLLERQLIIEGPLHFTIGRNIELKASNAKLASTQWSSAESLVSFQNIEISLNTWSLISGPILLESLVLDGLRVNLEENKTGQNNWTFMTSSSEQDSQQELIETEKPVVEDDSDSPGLSILPVYINITDMQLSYLSPSVKQQILLVIDKAQQVVDDAFILQFMIDGNINQTPLSLIASASTENHSIDYTDIDFNLNADLGELHIEASSVIDDLLKPSRPTISATINAPKIENISEAIGIKSYVQGVLNMQLEVQPVDEKMQLDLAAKVGELEVVANGEFVDLQTLEGIELQATANGPDIGIIKKFTTLPGKLSGPFNIEAQVIPEDLQRKTITLKADAGDITLNLNGRVNEAENFLSSQASIELKAASYNRIADALLLENIQDRSIAFSFDLEKIATGFSLQNGSLSFGKDKLDLSGVIANPPLQSATNIKFQTSIPDIKRTLSDFHVDVPQLPDGELVAQGVILGGDEKVVVKDLILSLPTVKASLQAQLSTSSILDDSKIDFSFKGDDLSALVPSNERIQVPEKAFNLDGSVLLKDNNVNISKLKFNVAKNQLSGDIKLSLKPEVGSVYANLTASGPDLNAIFTNSQKFSVNKSLPFDIRTEIAWHKGLLKINKLLAKVAEAKVDVKGSIQDPPNFNNTNLKFVIDIADIHNLSIIADRELPHEAANLTINLRGKGNTITAERFKGRLGDSDLHGNFFYRAAEIPEFKLKLISKKLDLSPYLQTKPQPGSKEKQEGQESATAKKSEDKQSTQNSDGRAIPDTAIPVELLQGYTAKLDIQIEDLTLKQHAARDLVLSAAVRNGALKVDEFHLETMVGGQIDGRLSVITKRNNAEIWASLNGKELTYGLPFENERQFRELPRYGIDMAFLTRGSNYREVSAALDGYFKLLSSAGKVKFASLQMYTNDFLLELLNKLNPFAKTDPETNLQCAVLLATVQRGKVVGEPALVIQSNRLNIFADTNIDLGSEELDVHFKTVPQKGLGIGMSNLVNPYIMVGGTLGSPTLELNPQGVIIDGGVAFATGGLSLLARGLKDRFLSDNKPCDAAIAETDEQFSILVDRYKNVP